MHLTYLIRVERKSQVQAPDGSLTTERIKLFDAYAHITPISGRERNQSSQTEASADYRFTIRRQSGLVEDDVIVWDGRDFNIRFISDFGPRSLYMTLDAERGVAV